ncbi:MAG TPA: Asp-tRNA(Asn)/Glu-tRNA(Gln) amidotransferase subunit GatB [Candidatus Saccharimonadales bacterium]|nr:Asp-tRNA(Asn)/Glu-tRNA(Gln) amidotransferase subunit GatB [Candidatus Saccharimonadales bacterium]
MIDRSVFDQYEPTIGIECHVQLLTDTKLFSGADNDARDKAPNSPGVVSPICFGLPGTLPVLNQRAIDLCIRAGVALNAEVAPVSSFDRKHYFYPDLPKGYQITQLHRPIIGKGVVEVPVGDQVVEVRIHHAHLEEDAGKSIHPAGADYSLVDYNRAGTPLIEIVSEPDIHSAAEAKAYVQELNYLMRYAGVTLGNLYYGNQRFDVNISVAKKGATALGTRAEVKNLNSFRSVEKAVEYEFKRQVELIERGESVAQETRGWHDAKQKTFSQRSKEEAEDYRYFPEADIPPVEVTPAQMEAAAKEVTPRLPWTIRRKLALSKVSLATTNTLLEFPDIIDACLAIQAMDNPELLQAAVNLLVNTELRFRKIGEDEQAEMASTMPPANTIASLVQLYLDKKLSSNGLLELYGQLRTEKDIASVDVAVFAEKSGLLQVSDTGEIEAIVAAVLADPASAKAVADVKAGEQKAIGFLVGKVMQQSKGKANPAMAKEIITTQLQI